MSAQNPAESAPSIDGSPVPAPVDPATIPGPHAANLGDGVNGRLSETDVDRITIAATSDGGPGDPLPAVVAAIVREHTERAWDEGFRAGWEECRDPEPFANDWWDSQTPNPYAARKEQS